MRVDSLLKLRNLFPVVAAAVLFVLLVMSTFVAHVLIKSQQRYYDSAEETSRNLSIVLENFLHSHFQEVDLTVRRAAEEFRTLHQQGRFTDAGFSAYLRSLKERVPEARSIRGSDRDGLVIYGEDVDLAKPQSLVIREFFQRAKTERELIFGVPVKSRITGEWVLPVMYALTLPDGSFGGTVYVNINSARITELFSSLNTGEHGVITLIDSRRRALHRFPEAKGGPRADGVVKLSPATLAVLATGHRRATYTTTSGVDGQRRVYSLGKIGNYPVNVLVGLSEADFLAPWRKEVRNAAFFLVVLVGLAVALLLGVRLALRRQYQVLDQLMQKDAALSGSVSALTESETRWRSLTEGLPQMVWTATAQRRVDFLSHHWHDYTGIGSAQLLAGGGWSGAVHPDDRGRVAAAWDEAAAGAAQFRCDCRLRRHDGAWRVFDNYALPQKNADGAVLCWVGSSTDITEAREAHDALLAAKEQALSAGRAKSEFVANMSHEIRSPMNAVLGMLQLLQQTLLDYRQRDYAAKAESAARSLLGLLNDILDFSKVEAGKLTLDPHPFSIDKLLRDLAVVLSANVSGKDIEVLFRIDPALPDWVVGDGLRLQQVLLNLAGNAIKFTERGEVLLSVQLLGRGDAGLSIGFALRDTGIGISAEHCQRIFDGFSQAEASTARRYGGTGLGLAISQRLVRLMGGTLRVESVAGQGSTFDFALDCQPAEAPEPAEAVDPAMLKRLDCLVVDDNPCARQVLTEMAGSFGWRVDAVEDGYAALGAVAGRGAERPYDVVIVDWRMPMLDGWETSKRIRQLTPAHTTPLIVMVTGHDREVLAQRQDQLSLVLDGVLVKPVTASMLFDVVADAKLGRRQFDRTGPVPSAQPLAGLRLLLVEDNPSNQQVAYELLSNEGAQVSVCGGGQAAIDALQRGGPAMDAILMDIQMPDMDGYAATRAIRDLLGAQAPPVIAMTANAMAADRVAALAAGMVDHVGKPFDLGQLSDVILRHVRRRDGVAAAAAPAVGAVIDPVFKPFFEHVESFEPFVPFDRAEPAQPATPEADEGIALNSAAAVRRMAGNTKVYLIALRSFAGEARRHAELLAAATSAQQSAAALPLLHTLKGLAGTVGAEQLAGLAGHAEHALRSADDDAVRWAAVGAVLAACPPAADAVDKLVARFAAAAYASELASRQR
ncbi:response regulator [Janthinobacterium sp. CG_S6]|uniref:response regulator n=1 Tax=Janthinobacterium sp. CG_S6 TaxID=3071707 RepID=UPI002DFAC133|nr:PAS domain S-box-containing protein [Janthinobacterium sp. CG_S6]